MLDERIEVYLNLLVGNIKDDWIFFHNRLGRLISVPAQSQKCTVAEQDSQFPSPATLSSVLCRLQILASLRQWTWESSGMVTQWYELGGSR